MAVVINGTTGVTTPTGTFATTIGVGGATPSASGAGITFPATQSASTDANTLDDYEEGTWTPSVNLLGTLTYTSYRNGTYTKIGKMVTVRFIVGVASTDGTQDSTALQVTGLPFTSSASLDVWTNGMAPCFTEYLGSGVSPATAAAVFGVSAPASSTSLQVACYQYNGTLASKSYMVASVARSNYSVATANMYISGQLSYIAAN